MLDPWNSVSSAARQALREGGWGPSAVYLPISGVYFASIRGFPGPNNRLAFSVASAFSKRFARYPM